MRLFHWPLLVGFFVAYFCSERGAVMVDDLHMLLVDSLLVAIALHVAANVYASFHHRENLIAAMVTGDKCAANGGQAPTPSPLSVSPHQPAIKEET